MLRTSTAFLAVASLFLSTITQAQVSDAVGDVVDPCIDIVQTDISANADLITAKLWVNDQFCPKAQYQFHVDVNGDGVSDYGYMAKLDRYGEFSFHGSPDLVVEIDESELGISFDIPVSELLDEYGVPVDEVAVWFRAHLAGEADLFPDKFEDRIDLPLGGGVLKVVGPEGGMVVDDDPKSPTFGTNITFPPGSLDKPVGISLKYEPDLAIPSNPDKEIFAEQPAFTILPDNLFLDPPATIAVPIPDEDQDGVVDGTEIPVGTGTLYYTFDNADEWFRADTIVDNISGFLIAKTAHFSKWNPIYRRWKSGSRVYYYIESLPNHPNYSSNSYKWELGSAFFKWEEAVRSADIQFWQVSDPSSADITVRAMDFYDRYPYCEDGGAVPDECWANANVEGRKSLTGPKTLTFNTRGRYWATGPYDPASYNESLMYSAGFEPFLRIAMHEIGHIMGLPDYSPKNTRANGSKVVMWYEDNGYYIQALTELDQWDIDELRDKYGVSSTGLYKGTLVNVRFEDGGTANGSFTYDSQRLEFTDWNIQVSGGNTSIYAPLTYTPQNSHTNFLARDTGTRVYFSFACYSHVDFYQSRERRIQLGYGSYDWSNFRVPLAVPGFLPLEYEDSFECYNCSPYRRIQTSSSGIQIERL